MFQKLKQDYLYLCAIYQGFSPQEKRNTWINGLALVVWIPEMLIAYLTGEKIIWGISIFSLLFAIRYWRVLKRAQQTPAPPSP